MALGSFATATNVSPMPTARAPTPMRRNVPDDVPARWPPSEPCARATEASSSPPAKAMARRAASLPDRLLEIDIELRPPHAVAVVRGVVDRAHVLELVEAGEVTRVGLAVAPAQPAAGERVHDVDGVVAEDVRAGDAEVEAALAELEPAVDLEIDRELRRGVERVRQPHRVARAGGDGRVRAARLRLRVDVDSDLLQNAPVPRRLVVPAHVEVGGELARPVPAHELLGQPRLVAAAHFLQRLLLVRVAALAARLLVGVRELAGPMVRAPLLQLYFKAFRARVVAVQINEIT